MLPIMAAALRNSSIAWNWHGLQGLDSTHLLGRKCSSLYSWGFGHVLADVGKFLNTMLLQMTSTDSYIYRLLLVYFLDSVPI